MIDSKQLARESYDRTRSKKPLYKGSFVGYLRRNSACRARVLLSMPCLEQTKAVNRETSRVNAVPEWHVWRFGGDLSGEWYGTELDESGTGADFAGLIVYVHNGKI